MCVCTVLLSMSLQWGLCQLWWDLENLFWFNFGFMFSIEETSSFCDFLLLDIGFMVSIEGTSGFIGHWVLDMGFMHGLHWRDLKFCGLHWRDLSFCGIHWKDLRFLWTSLKGPKLLCIPQIGPWVWEVTSVGICGTRILWLYFEFTDLFWCTHNSNLYCWPLVTLGICSID